jgi:tetratricopeptide (TPR) repeat protein
MEKNQPHLNHNHKKVVHLQWDACFFFERAIRSLDRHDYDKAVKYFRLAIEKEPDNSDNYCNLASILSELGRYEESNQLLETVMDQVDPHLYECLFYMANNAANLGDFQMAEDYLLEYLSYEPEGEYTEEAEDLLYMVALELGRPPREPIPAKLPAYLEKHDQARNHLEEGRFLQAITLLEELIEQEPHFLAARNNLSLAYYYTGRLTEAMRCIEQVLEVDPSNLHTLCNLAVLSHHMNEKKKSQLLIQTLRKLVPFQYDHAYKLATTMGILGEHEVAYKLFCCLLKTGEFPNASLYHYAAVAAYNTGRIRQALKYWKQATLMDPDACVPCFYFEQVQSWMKQGYPRRSNAVIPYQYHLPFEEQLLRMEEWKPDSYLLTELKENPLFRSSFFWALHHGNRHTKLKVLHVLGWLHDQEVEQVLRQFLLHPEEDEELKKIALIILKHMKASPPFAMWINDQKVEALQSEPSSLIKWQQVMDCCLQKIKQYDKSQCRDMEKSLQKAWAKWNVPDHDWLPSVKKVEAWAAALEYIVAKFHGVKVTQSELCRKYQIATSTLSKNIKQLKAVTQIFL